MSNRADPVAELVERLNGPYLSKEHGLYLRKQAATTIESITAERDELSRLLHLSANQVETIAAERDELQAEIERLKRGLSGTGLSTPAKGRLE